MTDEKIVEMLKADYKITLSGGHVAYLLKLLAQEQFALNEEARENILDIMAHQLAAANDVVGNSLLHEAYRVCGASFLAFAMDCDEASVKRFMESKTPDDLEKNAETITKKKQRKPNKNLN